MIRIFLMGCFSALLLLVSCGDDPTNRTPGHASFTIDIQNRKMDQTGPLEIQRGQEVTMDLQADEPGEVHVHGYDLRFELDPMVARSIEFVADYPGRFAVAFHPAKSNPEKSEHKHGDHGHDHHGNESHSASEIILVYIEVNP